MKLKHIVIAMTVLGVVSTSALAQYPSNTNSKHKHHKMKHLAHQTTYKDYKGTVAVHHKDYKGTVRKDYKDMGMLPIQPAVQVCTVTPDTITMTEMTQNIGRSLPNPCNPGWFNRIQLSGGVNVDMLKTGNRNAGYQGENYQRVSVNDAYINLLATVNDWTKVFASISYSDPTTSSNLGADETEDRFNPQYSSTYNGMSTFSDQGGAPNFVQTNLTLQQGFITIGNQDETPIFIQLGKQFVNFSRYEIHPITRSLTQVMSEVLATAAEVGFVVNGFNGSVYAFDNPVKRWNSTVASGGAGSNNPKAYRPTNYSASLGYDMPSNQFGWDIGVAYIYDLAGSIDTADHINYFTTQSGVHSPTSGGALYADMNTGPFNLGLRYTQAIARFNPLDLPRNGFAALVPGSGAVEEGEIGARPWAAGIQAGYGFDAWCNRPQNIYVGYQASSQAGALDIPRARFLAGYGIDVWKNTNFTAEWDHDTPYSFVNGGRGLGVTNLVTIRATANFG